MAQYATGNREEALDIVQDAMMTLVKRYSQRSESEWGALFHRIMQNRIRDWYRREKVKSTLRGWLGSGGEDVEDDPLANVADSAAMEPSRHLSSAQVSSRMEDAIQSLPLRQQQVFLLRVWEGLDIKQTATAMRISSGSVKTHYSRAVNSLREKLGEHYYE